MLRRLGGSSNSLWRPKNPHSLEYLKYLHGVLTKNEKVTDSNRKILVEALRAIAEILIWGDQNDSTVFDFFLERQMLSHFLQIMKQESGSLNVQLLQTLNILFENIRHETSLYFLLSNNHVNFIVTHKFDLENEEIMAYYISFLKTLSFKLNACTIHFFFTEGTEEFPLLSEALKLFDHPESMVRIAVRNIFLNIARVNDPAMLDYLKRTTVNYLCEIVDNLVGQSIELDTFVRSAENVIANRERLRDKVDDLVDLIHYLGELLQVDTLAETLCGLVYSRYLLPLLLNSLAPRRHNSSLLLTPVSSLFLFSQFLLIVTHKETVQNFLTAFLFEDCSILNAHWIRSGDSFILTPVDNNCLPGVSRVFFDALVSAFDASKNDDYLSFYGLMLIYAMFQNKGDVAELLAAANIPVVESRRRNNTQGVEFGEEAIPPELLTSPVTIRCDERITSALLSVIEASGKEESRLRPVTLELACIVLRQLLLATDADQMHSKMTETARNARKALVTRLAVHVHSENLFLEWFEDEYAVFESMLINIEVIGAEMLLPPCATALSGLSLHKRLPSGFEERIRSLIQLYFHVRKLEKDLTDEADTELPISLMKDETVSIGDCINLNNSDLLSCTIHVSKSEKLSRFLVTDRLQLILVEPDAKKAGWAVVRFVGLLQDTQITGDPSDSRALHLVVEGQPSRNKKRQSILTAKFVFDDHIRCMAAKQRLTKGRQMARTAKLHAICDVLGIPRMETASPRCNPFRIVKGCPPGSVKKQVLAAPLASTSASASHSSLNSLNSIPDDPVPGAGKVHLV